MGEAAVTVHDLHKSYGDFEAVRGISFEIAPGEIFGFLGPNGAGKSTTIEILEGYRSRNGGDAWVLGTDPAKPTRAWRDRIGLVLQESELEPTLTVRETIRMFAGFYSKPRPVDDVIGLVGLEDKADARVGGLSGGQKRRADVAVALIGDPDLVFLDEPTTGFDPAARRQAWETIRGLRELGRSILLTTHYMEEAQALADRLGILRDGRIVATGSPRELLSSAEGVEIRYRRNGEELVISTDEPTRVLHELTSEALAEGIELEDIEVRRRSLEDLYLELTREEAEVG